MISKRAVELGEETKSFFEEGPNTTGQKTQVELPVDKKQEEEAVERRRLEEQRERDKLYQYFKDVEEKKKKEHLDLQFRGLKQLDIRPDLSRDKVLEIAHNSPDVYIGTKELEGRFPEFLDLAVEELLKKYPATYFMSKMNERADLKKFNQKALVRLLAVRPSTYYDQGLFNDTEFKPYNKAAAFATASLDPKYFLNVVLKRFPEFKSLKNLAETKQQKIPGGLGEHLDPADVDPKQLHMGVQVESEHTGDPELAREIALDHLAEDPQYYTKLQKMEKGACAISKRAAKPYAVYGWWLSPEGKAYEVGREQHGSFVVNHPELFGELGDYPNAYDMAFSRGWIRVVNDSVSINFESQRLDEKTIHTIQNSINQFPVKEMVFISDVVGRNVEVPRKHFLSAKNVDNLLDIERSVKDEDYAISKSAASVYGWWISPEGKAYEVPEEGHGDFVREHPELFGVVGEKDYPYKIAFDAGWVRAVLESDCIYFEVIKPTNSMISLIKKALSNLPKRSDVAIDNPTGDFYVKIPYKHFMAAESYEDIKDIAIVLSGPKEDYAASKTASIDYPATTHQAIYEWVEQILPTIQPEQILKKQFDVDPNEVKQLQPLDLEPTVINVEAYGSAGKEDFAGYYTEENNTLYLYDLCHQLQQMGYDKLMARLDELIAHELVHFTQVALTYGLDEEAGLPGNYDPEIYDLYSDVDPNELTKKQLDLVHAISDIEFYPRLEETKKQLQRALSSAAPGDQRKVFDQVLEQSDVVKALKEASILSAAGKRKYQKYISELAKYFHQLTEGLKKTECVRHISKRASQLGPIAPMKLKKLSDPEELLKDYKPEDLIVQGKIDGFKTMAIKSGGQVKLYTRRGEDFTQNVPSIVKAIDIPDDTFILGELAWIGEDGKQSISDVQTVVGSNPDKAQQHANGNLVFYVYDLLWLKGKDLTKTPYIDRYTKLQELGLKSPVELVKNYTFDQRNEAIEDALKVGGEGVVIKPKAFQYKYGPLGGSEPVGENWKFKPGAKSRETDVILKSYEKGKEKLVFPAYQLKGGEYFEVGKLSGMSKEEESEIKNQIDAGKEVVVEVGYQDRMESGKLRHMSWRRLRPDKPASEVKMASISKRALKTKPYIRFGEIDITLYGPFKNIDEARLFNFFRRSEDQLNDFLKQHMVPRILSYIDENIEFYDDEEIKTFSADPELGGFKTFKVLPASNILTHHSWKQYDMNFIWDYYYNSGISKKALLLKHTSLESYHSKRDFETTSEPEGKEHKGPNKHRYVIQTHDAEKAGQHFDLRLENDQGTLSSWAIPKAKLPGKGERLLATQTEDHPIEYARFGKGKGEVIEEGYGKGKIKIHSKGTYTPVECKRDTIKFEIPAGKFTLRRMNGKKWMLMRSKAD